MKRRTPGVLVGALVLSVAVLWAWVDRSRAGSAEARTSAAAAATDDRMAVERTVRRYFRGDVERDVESLKEAFHPRAELLTAGEDGSLDVLTQEAWHESVRATPDRERPDPEILSVDIHGGAAVAKTRLTFSDGRFTDYLSLLKLGEEWVIVNKIYHWEDF